MRDSEFYLVEIDTITFNHRDFSRILIPINHINFDQRGQRRSEYTVEEIAETLCLALNQLELLPDGKKDNAEYFVYIFKVKGKLHKLVFSIEEDEITIEVLTLFRVRRS